MEFMDGICRTRECAWDVLLSESMKDQEAIVEGAIHSIRNMGDVAFVILRKKEGLFQTVYENDKTNVSIHDLKEAMCVRLTGTLHEEERAPHGRELRISMWRSFPHLQSLFRWPSTNGAEHFPGGKAELSSYRPA